jgi:hypothetical protein
MKKYAVFSLFPAKIKIVQAESLASEEIEIIENYALPFGSDWPKTIGARSVKSFPINRDSVCFAYTIVASTGNKQKKPALHCLAFIKEYNELSTIMASRLDWINATIGPMIQNIENKKLKQAFINSLVPASKEYIHISFCHWLSLQFHFKLMPAFIYRGMQSWTLAEEYVRRLYTSREWQSALFGTLPPSFTTLTLSKGEFTNIAIMAIPER